MQSTQTEVVYVFGSFYCDDFENPPIHYLNELEYGDVPIS